MTVDTNTWEELQALANERIEAADSLRDNSFGRPSVESAHLALELIIKSSLKRANGHYPPTRELSVLTSKRINGESIKATMTPHRYTKLAYTKVQSAWDMQYRYNKWPHKDYDLDELIEAYKKVFTWIEQQYLP